MAAVLEPVASTPVKALPTPCPSCGSDGPRSGEVALLDPLRLVRLASDPGEVICADRIAGEVVLLDALTRAGHMVSRWTSRLQMVEPGVVRDVSGREHTLHVSSVSLFLSLRTRARGL